MCELLAGYSHERPVIIGINNNQKPGYLGPRCITN